MALIDFLSDNNNPFYTNLMGSQQNKLFLPCEEVGRAGYAIVVWRGKIKKEKKSRS